MRRAVQHLVAARRWHVEAASRAGDDAYGRARALLRRCLTPAQRRQFDRQRAFLVKGRSGRTYRIGHSAIVNIEVLSADGDVECRLCAGPAGLPVPAIMLAQKLMLESREAEFLRIAIRHPAWPQPF